MFLVKHLCFLMLWLGSHADAQTDGFSQSCEKLAAESDVRVVFEAGDIRRDDSRSQDELRRMSGLNSSPYHSVLGLTHAQPAVSVQAAHRFLAAADGRICVAPQVNVKLGFATLQVYLARELIDPCRRSIVAEHEQEHVAVWRDHFRVGARLLETRLRADFGRPAHFSDRQQAETALREQIDRAVAQHLGSLGESIESAHRQIDSPASYRYQENRMRACP